MTPSPSDDAPKPVGPQAKTPSRPLWHRMVLHKNGKLCGWFRKVLRQDQQGTPRLLTRRVLFQSNVKVRSIFAAWYAPYDGNPGNGHVRNYADFLRGVIASSGLVQAHTMQFFNTQHTESVGATLARALRDTLLAPMCATQMPPAFDRDHSFNGGIRDVRHAAPAGNDGNDADGGGPRLALGDSRLSGAAARADRHEVIVSLTGARCFSARDLVRASVF